MARRPCDHCGGSGQFNGGRGWNGCGTCGGSGSTRGNGIIICPICNGNGYTGYKPDHMKGCITCGGGGEGTEAQITYGHKKINCPDCLYSTWGRGTRNCDPCNGTGWLN